MKMKGVLNHPAAHYSGVRGTKRKHSHTLVLSRFVSHYRHSHLPSSPAPPLPTRPTLACPNAVRSATRRPPAEDSPSPPLLRTPLPRPERPARQERQERHGGATLVARMGRGRTWWRRCSPRHPHRRRSGARSAARSPGQTVPAAALSRAAQSSRFRLPAPTHRHRRRRNRRPFAATGRRRSL